MTSRAGQRGFSLLEMLVAISILAVSLGGLYQAASGATRNVRVDERYAYAVELARTLVARNTMVPPGGVSDGGQTDAEYRWRVQSRPVNFDRSVMAGAQLHELEVSVSWEDGPRRREVTLNTVVEAYRE